MISKVAIRHAILSNRIILARFGKDPSVALETRDVMSEFWQALVSFAYDGEMPEPGAKVEISFGGGDEQFSISIQRSPASPARPAVTDALRKMEQADQGLANAYSATHNDYDKDRLACERIGLQKGISIVRAALQSAAPAQQEEPRP